MKNFKTIASIIIVIMALLIAYSIGYHAAILDAQIIEVEEDYYLIDFNGQVHEYE